MLIRRELEAEALLFCRAAWRHAAERRGGRDAAPPGTAEARAAWLLPGLARRVAEHHDRPMRDLVASLRGYVQEQTFVEDAGDPVIDPQVRRETLAALRAAVRAHRALRHRVAAPADGRALPNAPLMCG